MKYLQKTKEIILYILSEIGNKPNFGKAVLLKLLFFIDFYYYQKFKTIILGLTYIKKGDNIYVMEFKELIENMVHEEEIEDTSQKYFNYMQKKYIVKRKADIHFVTKNELQIVNSIIKEFGDRNNKELIECIEINPIVIKTKEGNPIVYEKK